MSVLPSPSQPLACSPLESFTIAMHRADAGSFHKHSAALSPAQRCSALQVGACHTVLAVMGTVNLDTGTLKSQVCPPSSPSTPVVCNEFGTERWLHVFNFIQRLHSHRTGNGSTVVTRNKAVSAFYVLKSCLVFPRM